MLRINMEYRKGVLFIRFNGDISKKTYKSLNDYLIPLINNEGIKYIVYNLDKVNTIDSYGKRVLKNGINAVKKNDGKGIICNSKGYLFKEYKTVDNELTALRLLKI